MLISTLLVVLILVILFREEIRTILGLGLLYILIVGLWENEEWWGKPLVIVLAILFLLGIIAGFINKYIEKHGENSRFIEYTKAISQMLLIAACILSVVGGIYYFLYY